VRKIFLTLLLISLSACSTTLKEVHIPVGVGCPKIEIASAGKMRRLPIEDINKNTPVDVSARWWKASLYLALAHKMLVELERDSLRKAYDKCTSIPKPDLQPVDVPPQ
jgi:hypothetical protein